MKHALVAAVAMLLSVPAHSAGDSDWNQWRGPKRDGLSPDTGLLKSWPSGGPTLLWKATGVGGGFSSVSIQGDKIFTLGDLPEGCSLIALKAADGGILWQCKVGEAGGGGGYPGPRCSPATDGTLVFALGQHGDLVCVEAAGGKEVWRKKLDRDFGGKMMSGWGYSESPLLDGDLILCSPGGSKGTVLALKKATGDVVWQSTELTDKATYSSLVPTEIAGVRQYLVLTEVSVAGIAPETGKVLWRADRIIEKPTAIVATPVYKDGMVFVTSSYPKGTCNAYKVTATDGKFKAEELYSGMQLKNHHGGVVLVGDHVYGTDDRKLKCLELKTGKVVWEENSVGKGSITYADGHLILRSENPKSGEVALVEASPAGYKESGRFSQPDPSNKKTWAHPVVAGGKLYLRNQDLLYCYDLKAK